MQRRLETRVGIFVIAALGVFMYMGFKVGAFRFDRGSYHLYTLYFKDVSGLSRKAEVKIAGVKVGWVQEVDLHIDCDVHKVRVDIMVYKNYAFYSNAYGIVRQEGLLGSKFIEVSPGDPLLHQLEPGGTFAQDGIAPISIDELLKQFSVIAEHVQEVSESFKGAVGGVEGREQLRSAFEKLHYTADSLATFSDRIDRSLGCNDAKISALLSLGENVQGITDALHDEVIPAFQKNIDRMSTAIEEASLQARDGLRGVTSIADKIDEGKGILGKMVNEDETYRDLCVAVSGFKNYVTKIDRMQIVFDFHSESMLRSGEGYPFKDSKGYFNIRIHPTEGYFYLLQLASSERGFRWRDEVHPDYCDRDGKPVNVEDLNILDRDRLEFTFRRKHEIIRRNTVRLGLQFGKIFGDFALRAGLFEGSAGIGIDLDLPFKTDNFRWVTTFELFDLSGWNRKNDRHPHLKWFNRMFLFKTLYAVFGADDIVSKKNASVFFGIGLRFGDDDVKYLLSNISFIQAS